mgnify:FL=1
MIVTVEELSQTSLYPEIIKAITRDNTQAAELQILAAESLTRSYMSKYDCDAIFGTVDKEPTYKGAALELIKKVIKIIASYYLVRLATPNVDLELFRLDYQDALDWLKDLQKGDVAPDLPYKPDDPNTPNDESGDSVAWTSNIKRNNHF